MAEFVAVDVETANSDMASICQIGLVHYLDGGEVGSACWLVDPEDYFDDENIAIHGITSAHVKGQPNFGAIAERLLPWLACPIVVCHTHFDRVSLAQAFRWHVGSPPACNWLDTAMVARRTWPDVARAGYGLANLAQRLNITFKHHDALEDARAAASVLLCAIRDSGIDLHDWPLRTRKPINLDSGHHIRRTGDGDGPLIGETIVFTGALAMSRRDVADRAHELGAAVDPGVTKKTTILVVGDQDISKLAGHQKSSKHRKAEALIAAGQPIRILRETDFLAFSE